MKKRTMHRGKTSDGKFVYGTFIKLKGYQKGRSKYCIIPADYRDTSRCKEPIKPIQVLQSSVSESTGQFDKYKREIYENDWLILKPTKDITYYAKVYWNAKLGCWGLKGYAPSYVFLTAPISNIATIVPEEDIPTIKAIAKSEADKFRKYNTVKETEI